MAYTVMFNTTAIHGLPAALNAASNALLQAVASGDARIGVRNHPMPTLPGEPAIKFSKIAGAALLSLPCVLPQRCPGVWCTCYAWMHATIQQAQTVPSSAPRVA